MRSIIRTYCKFHESIQHFQINVYIINDNYYLYFGIAEFAYKSLISYPFNFWGRGYNSKTFATKLRYKR